MFMNLNESMESKKTCAAGENINEMLFTVTNYKQKSCV